MNQQDIECLCGHGFIRYGRDEEEKDIWYIGHYVSMFYERQRTLGIILDRFKMAWSIIFGREFLLHEYLVDESEMKKLHEWLKETVSDE